MNIYFFKYPPHFNDCFLYPKQIDIWQFPLSNEVDSSRLHFLLDVDEKKKANRFYFPHHRQKYITAHSCTKLILSRYLNIKSAILPFTYGSKGKPYLKLNPQKLQFNLSHSGSLALLAIGTQYELGIDLEFFSPRPYHGIAKSIFSSKELAQFNQLPTHAKPCSFFNVWVQKEAFIKSVGLGLSYPLSTLTVPLFPQEEPIKIKDIFHKKEWSLLAFMPQPLVNAALCYHPSVDNIRYFNLTTIQELLL